MFQFLMRIFQQMDMYNEFLYMDKRSMLLLQQLMHFLARDLQIFIKINEFCFRLLINMH